MPTYGHVEARVCGLGGGGSAFRSSAARRDLNLQPQSKLLPAKEFGVLAGSVLRRSS